MLVTNVDSIEYGIDKKLEMDIKQEKYHNIGQLTVQKKGWFVNIKGTWKKCIAQNNSDSDVEIVFGSNTRVFRVNSHDHIDINYISFRDCIIINNVGNLGEKNCVLIGQIQLDFI